jgi:hypothetical protein
LKTEEAKDKIYKLPPPGNGTVNRTGSRQLTTEFFTRMHVNDPSPVCSDNTGNNDNIEGRNPSHDDKYTLKILQWNACSLEKSTT